MWLPATPSKLSNPHAMLQLLPKPCYIALFHEPTIERPVALAARGRNYRTAKQEGEKKKSGRSKGGGRREPRPRLHPWRPAFTDRPPCLQSKDNGITVERNLLRSCECGRTQYDRRAHNSPAQSDVLWPSSEQARDERYDEQHQEYEKQYFRDLRGACGDATES